MAKQSATFFDTDFTQMFDQFKLPGFDPETFLTVQRRNFEAVTAANQLAAEGWRAVAERQAEITREAVETYAGAVREMLATGSADDKVARQAELTKAGYETAAANTQELTELAVKAQGEAFDVLNKRVREGLDEFKAIVAKDTVVKSSKPTAPKAGKPAAPKGDVNIAVKGGGSAPAQ
jgi:phasin family protein